ncbi:MAG: alpha-glucan family phosphorylase [Anaerolineae bacterium]|nr:alpha-glucan family phosphorylase [Anaerolineae bacterium]
MKPISTFNVHPSIPEPLKRLPELVYNIHWAWDYESLGLFQRMEPDIWEESGHNQVQMLGRISQERLNELAQDRGFLAQYQRVMTNHDGYLDRARSAWYPTTYGLEERAQIAYFSLEFGLTESIRNYSGGLGILAGDHLKASSDLNIPLVAVGLLYQQGYFRQYLNADGWQQELYPANDFYTMPIRLMKDPHGEPMRVAVSLPGRDVYAQIWHVKVGRINLYLLDTNIPENTDREDQNLTDQLYGGDVEMRIKQEILLGIGGLRALQVLGIDPTVCHMNEGHSAFLGLERIRGLMKQVGANFEEAWAMTSPSNIFTTHTPVPAGNDYFAPDLIEKYFGTYRDELGLTRDGFLALGRTNPSDPNEHFCMTILALRMSAFANGVSKLHGEVARSMWTGVYPGIPLKEVPIGAITNGVHNLSWISSEMAQLYDRYLGLAWRDDPTDAETWRRALNIPDEELWRTHERRRQRLVNFARRRLVRQLENRGATPSQVEAGRQVLDPEVLTIGFARRFATYKRATLLLSDKERLLRILNGPRPVQFVFAGKAHPHDVAGKDFIRQLVHFATDANCRHRMVFLEDYDMVIGRYMTQGVDVWLNTPRRPLEASGTSGMKASLNGVLNMSVLDGWWDEAYTPEVGWAIGNGEVYKDTELQDYIESSAIYDLLEHDLIPTFYDRSVDDVPREWTARMKSCIATLNPAFSMARTVKDYTESFYQPALEQHRALAADQYHAGREVAQWLGNLKNHWNTLAIGDIVANGNDTEFKVGDTMHVVVEVFLGEITPADVAVQLFEGVLDAESVISDGQPHRMMRVDDGARGKGWHQFRVDVPCLVTGRHGYTVRVVPHYKGWENTLRFGLIRWAQV